MIIPCEYDNRGIYRKPDDIGIWFDYINWEGQTIKAAPKIVFPNFVSISLEYVFPVEEELPYPLNFALFVENIAHKQFKETARKKWIMHKEFKIFFKKQRLYQLTDLLCKFIPLPTEINYIIAEFI
ncbi:Hypothetical protein PACV_304 [Pacmanvirus A23]|uniref:Hypothetical protein n=1 Tax=Pacmanvirus A23 TaxID=1932881 RepID=UPI000A0947A9|nr:Hypothetical protein B9W72_gp300 [Pacmanvirus A23]SIP86017.1 Hypothetical protein PACV_304 [Pacmanvirus A23]